MKLKCRTRLSNDNLQAARLIGLIRCNTNYGDIWSQKQFQTVHYPMRNKMNYFLNKIITKITMINQIIIISLQFCNHPIIPCTNSALDGRNLSRIRTAVQIGWIRLNIVKPRLYVHHRAFLDWLDNSFSTSLYYLRLSYRTTVPGQSPRFL